MMVTAESLHLQVILANHARSPMGADNPPNR